MKLIIEVATDEDENAPLSEAEINRVEKALERVKAGDFKVTNDPAERDSWGSPVLFYRRAEDADGRPT